MSRSDKTIRALRLVVHHLLPQAQIARYLHSSSRKNDLPKFNILFCGSDKFSIGSLAPLLEERDLWERLEVVVSGEKVIGRDRQVKPLAEEQIERPGKRRKTTVRPPLHDFALEHGLKVHTVPETGLKDWIPSTPFDQSKSRPEFPEHPISTPAPPRNILVTSSFGHILPTPLLKTHFPVPSSRLNLHPSLLPKYRGAAPVQWAIARGDGETGCTVQSLAIPGDEGGVGGGIDTGLIWGQVGGLPIGEHDTYSSMIPNLATRNGHLLVRVLRQIQDGTASARSQDHAEATRAKKITRDVARINFECQTAVELERLSRGIGHQHPLWTTANGRVLQLLDVRLAPLEALLGNSCVAPGTAHFQKHVPDDIRTTGSSRLLISCSSKSSSGPGYLLDLRAVQEEGKRKPLHVSEWWNGVGKEDRARRWLMLGT